MDTELFRGPAVEKPSYREMRMSDFCRWNQRVWKCVCCHHSGTHQGAVRLRRVSAGDVWGIQGDLQVLGHVCCLWLARHVVPSEAFIRVNLGLADVVVAPRRWVVLHGCLAQTGPKRLQHHHQMETHDCSSLFLLQETRDKKSLLYFHLMQLSWREETCQTRWLLGLLSLRSR